MNNNFYNADFFKEIKDALKIIADKLKKNNNKQNASIKLGNYNSSEYSSSYGKEIQKMKELISVSQKYTLSKNSALQSLSDFNDKNSLNQINSAYESTASLIEKLGLDSAQFSNIFIKAFDNITEKSQSFSQSMKNMLEDLKNYFIKTMAKAISESIVSSELSQGFLNSVSASSVGKNGIASVLTSFISLFSNSKIQSHHSGGQVPFKAGFSLPDSREYLALLKGGERVLSPSENASFSNNMEKQNPVIVNNFNIKAWDSKDVQKYLLENKNLLANITADNIKYNNANLRYMIGG